MNSFSAVILFTFYEIERGGTFHIEKKCFLCYYTENCVFAENFVLISCYHSTLLDLT